MTESATSNSGINYHQRLDIFVPHQYESASAFHQTEWVDVDTISITMVANAVLAFLCLAYFWRSRLHDPGHFSSRRRWRPYRTPPDLPNNGFFSWIRPLMSIPEDEILRYAGFDAMILLRFYKLAFKVFGTFAFYGLLVIVPANVQGGSRSGSYEYQTNINTFNRLSMSNIQHYDPRMWLHALGVYGLTGITMYFLLIEYRFYTSLRHKFLRKKAAHLRTIMVEGVPHEMRSNSKLFTYFNTLYPDEVISVHTPQDVSYLECLLNARHDTIALLRKGVKRQRDGKEEPYHFTGGWCCLGKRVKTVGYCTLRLQRLNEAIAKEQARKKSRHRKGYMSREQSISVVDMNYELGEEPELEAGPIERLVLEEEGLSESDSESSTGSTSRARSGTGEGPWWGGGRGGTRNPPGSPRMPADQVNHDPIAEAVKNTLQHFGPSNHSPRWWGWGRKSSPVKKKCEMGPGGGGKRMWGSGSLGASEYTSLLSAGGKDATAAAIKIPEKRKKEELGYAPRAFVTFRSFGAATVARQRITIHLCAPSGVHYAPWLCTGAGRYFTVLAQGAWQQLVLQSRGMCSGLHTMRWLMVEFLLLVLTIFFPVIVTLLSFAVSSESLMQHSQWVKDICAESALFQSLMELIQPLCLLGLMATLPRMLRWVGHVEGIMAESWNQMVVLSRYFSFQVLNVFLVTTIAGSVFEVVTRVVNHPSDVFTLLGETLPKPSIRRQRVDSSASASSSAGGGPALPPNHHRLRVGSAPAPGSSGRAGPVPVYVSPSSKREIKKVRFFYGQVFAQDLLVVVLVMTYGCIAPVVLIAAIMFFGYAQIIYRHQLLYVYVPTFESGGSFFPKVFRRWVFALFTAQATMVGMCLLKNGFNQACSLGFLMILTYIFKMKMREMYEPVSFSLPLEMATGLDLDRQKAESLDGNADIIFGQGEWEGEYSPSPDDYMQPELRETAYLRPEQLCEDLEIDTSGTLPRYRIEL